MTIFLKRFGYVVTTFAAMALVTPCAATSPLPATQIMQKRNDSLPTPEPEQFQWQADRFADTRVLRYKVDGFENLTPKQRMLIYYLSEASLAGRDILFDQFYKHNLVIRQTLDAIVEGYQGDRDTPEWAKFMEYVKMVWFCNGIHHHLSLDKLVPGFSKDYFAGLFEECEDVDFPLTDDQEVEDLATFLTPILFDPTIAPKLVADKKEGTETDLVKESSVNFYKNVTQKEVDDFYDAMKAKDPNPKTPISYGLNTKLVKENGEIKELVASAEGMYGPAIQVINHWLGKAATVAENDQQKKVINKLMEYYRTGDLKTFDDYSVEWVKDLSSPVDFVNGFIEVYHDPLGRKGTWEAIVNFKDQVASKRVDALCKEAQWFEDNSPVAKEYKKEKVQGVAAKVITMANLGGATYPTSPLGINLPNSNWIREAHGSKSVTIGNIGEAFDKGDSGSGMLAEFCSSPEEVERAKQYGGLAGNLHTDMHEALGHGSGKMKPGITGSSLGAYHSPIEETRADLFGLYYIADPKLKDLKLVNTDEVYKAKYDGFIRNGLLTQMIRLKEGTTIPASAHMKGRALTAKWVYEKGLAKNVISKIEREGKTYFKINDYVELRRLFAEFLAEIQRITSEGDIKAAAALVDNYAKVDPELHKQVLARVKPLNLPTQTGFMNPEYTPVYKNGKMVDATISYPTDYVQQMLEYGKHYSFLTNKGEEAEARRKK